MPPKNPGDTFGNGRTLNNKTPEVTSPLRRAWDEIEKLDLASPMLAGPKDDPHDWTLILVPSHIVAANAGAETRDWKTIGISRHDPKIRFLWPDVLRDIHMQVFKSPPRTVIETREFRYTRQESAVAEFLALLRTAHNHLTARRAYPASWTQL